jgi:glycosyltransferase involved in cell wall biosynthesis
MRMTSDAIEVSVVLPCLNEAETLAECVRKARRSLAELDVKGEVIVSDNGSTDGSQAIAEANGARVVPAPIRGYGGALMAGIEAAEGEYVIMADSDDSYDLSNLGPFIQELRAGHDLVMGNRFRGGIAKGAMPFLHRYLGNPVLSWLGRALLGLKNVGDFHCGIRGFHRERIRALNLPQNWWSEPPSPGTPSPRFRPRCAPTVAADRRTCGPGGTGGGICASSWSSRHARPSSGPGRSWPRSG